MTLQKLPQTATVDTAGFSEPVHVQGGSLYTRGDDRLVESGGRFKIFNKMRARLVILSGEGYIKWARGETPFAAGDGFLCDGEGELDLYGACAFLLARE